MLSTRHIVATFPAKIAKSLGVTIKLECLRKFIIFGKRHLDHIVNQFAAYYNHHRSHMERDHLPPIREAPDEIETLPLDQIEVRSHVGGLVKSLERKAA